MTDWTYGFRIEVVHDPMELAEAAVDVLDGRTQPTGWIQRLRRTGRASTRDDVAVVDGVHLYRGRACCFAHLSSLQGRIGADLRPPVETDCTECRRRFRVILDARPRENSWRTRLRTR